MNNQLTIDSTPRAALVIRQQLARLIARRFLRAQEIVLPIGPRCDSAPLLWFRLGPSY